MNIEHASSELGKWAAVDVKNEVNGSGNMNQVGEAIDVDEDEARIDALITKYRSQAQPKVDEI